MYGIYGNIYHQYTPVMLAYIPYMDPMGKDGEQMLKGDDFEWFCEWSFGPFTSMFKVQSGTVGPDSWLKVGEHNSNVTMGSPTLYP